MIHANRIGHVAENKTIGQVTVYAPQHPHVNRKHKDTGAAGPTPRVNTWSRPSSSNNGRPVRSCTATADKYVFPPTTIKTCTPMKDLSPVREPVAPHPGIMKIPGHVDMKASSSSSPPVNSVPQKGTGQEKYDSHQPEAASQNAPKMGSEQEKYDFLPSPINISEPLAIPLNLLK